MLSLRVTTSPPKKEIKNVFSIQKKIKIVSLADEETLQWGGTSGSSGGCHRFHRYWHLLLNTTVAVL